MNKKARILLYILSGLVFLFLITLFVVNPIIENKIKEAVSEALPKNFQAHDFIVDVNIMKGNATLHEITLKKQQYTDTIPPDELTLNKIALSGFGYFDYLFNNKLSFESLLLSEVNLIRYRDTTASKDTAQNKTMFSKSININTVKVENASIQLKDADGTTLLETSNINLSLKKIRTDSLIVKQVIPFEYSQLEIEAGALSYQLNDYDLLTYKNLSFDQERLDINELHIKTQYSKTELSKAIEKERDHMNVELPSIVIEGLKITSQDSVIHILGASTTIHNPSLKVYRDKLVADDTSIKPLYSKSLRELPFALTMDSLFIKNANILYEENIKAEDPPGKVYFSGLEAAIGNFSNTYGQGEKKTTIDITSTFMENSPLQVDWNFDINNTEDTFQFSGQLGSLQAKQLNSFAKASLNVNLEGTLDQTYFNINGNNNNSQIDMRLEFDDFKIEVLNKKERKNWFLSTVANIFVKRDSDDTVNDFKEGNGTASRNKDKSFFNYLWINLQAGLKNILTHI